MFDIWLSPLSHPGGLRLCRTLVLSQEIKPGLDRVSPGNDDVLLWPLSHGSFSKMSTAHEIKGAIRMLSPVEREKLIKDLPALLPELDGDLAWNRIIYEG